MKRFNIFVILISIVLIYSCKKDEPKDTTAPVIELIGSNPTSADKDSEYIDEGANAQDDMDGDISANIKVTGNVNTSTVGTYFVKYNVTDKAGNAAKEVTRTVKVLIF